MIFRQADFTSTWINGNWRSGWRESRGISFACASVGRRSEIVPGKPIAGDRTLFPTLQAIRTEPAFAEMSAAELDVEMKKIRSESDENGAKNVVRATVMR